jgi:hypothetical protein
MKFMLMIFTLLNYSSFSNNTAYQHYSLHTEGVIKQPMKTKILPIEMSVKLTSSFQ